MKAASESGSATLWRRFVDWLQGPLVRPHEPLPVYQVQATSVASVAAEEPVPVPEPEAPLPARIASEVAPDPPPRESRAEEEHSFARELEETAQRALEEPEPLPFDAQRLATTVALLEDRVLALHQELRGERDGQRALQDELATERERAAENERVRDEERARANRAEEAGSKTREEMHAYRRVLAAAVANEKYAIDLARKSRQEAQARSRELEEAMRARGEAEGRALELDRRVTELLAPRPEARVSHARAAAILALALVLAGVGLAQWGAAIGALVSQANGATDRLPTELALGTGAFAVAGILWGAWRREIRSMESGARVRRTA